MTKKAQGLSFNMIVLAIIALFVLLIIIAWATGAFGWLFGEAKVVAEVTEADITAAQTKCTQYCLRAQGARTIDAWTNSTYCKEVMFSLDTNEDGEPDEDVKCWHPMIGVACSTEIEDETITENSC